MVVFHKLCKTAWSSSVHESESLFVSLSEMDHTRLAASSVTGLDCV